LEVKVHLGGHYASLFGEPERKGEGEGKRALLLNEGREKEGVKKRFSFSKASYSGTLDARGTKKPRTWSSLGKGEGRERKGGDKQPPKYTYARGGKRWKGNVVFNLLATTQSS